MSKEKIVSPQDLESLCQSLHSKGAMIVFTNGVFDLLHPGHVQYLTEAGQLGTHLLVALNTDASTRKIKGDKHPLLELEARMEVLAALEAVSLVTWFDEVTPADVIRLVRPDVLVKGGDWKTEEIVGKDFVESYGGRVLSLPFQKHYSTTNIVDRILNLP